MIGSYSMEYSTWCWSWYNESYTSEQCKVVSDIRDQSIALKWPEANLFNTPVIDCESTFAFAIAHLCVGRMEKNAVVVYPFMPSENENGPKLFLALELPKAVLESINQGFLEAIE